MSVADLFKPLPLLRGPAMKNRFMLAPLTNEQSHDDGTASEDDIAWLSRCAQGGHALVQTCAATVQATGKAFPGQLGIHSDQHLDGLRRLADVIRAGGALSAVQLHHAGHRARPELGGVPAPASDDPARGFVAISTEQVQAIRDDFILAAKRAEIAGFDGVAVHGAFGWILSEFLSPTLNTRSDQYGGSLENRSRLLFEVIDGIRRACSSTFQIGLRISVERYGLRIEELRDITSEAFRLAHIDYLDLALWDSNGIVMDGSLSGKRMLDTFTRLPRGGVRVGTAGKVRSAKRCAELLEEGCDFVLIGRAAVLRADFPEMVRQDPAYVSPDLPVSEEYLRKQGLSRAFIGYMRNWDGFVA
jgi:2,4-dienoyl-CoA reductase-like NADH-dependent reductase (Old Yellow Enzyme family)